MLFMKYKDKTTERRSIFGVQRLFYTSCFEVCFFFLCVGSIKLTYSLIILEDI